MLGKNNFLIKFTIQYSMFTLFELIGLLISTNEKTIINFSKPFLTALSNRNQM